MCNSRLPSTIIGGYVTYVTLKLTLRIWLSDTNLENGSTEKIEKEKVIDRRCTEQFHCAIST